MKSKILYYILTLFTIYVAIMYEGSRAATFLAFELLLFISMFFQAWHLKRGIEVKLEMRQPVTGKQQAIPVKIHITNKHRLPAVRILLRLVFENDYTYRSGQETLWCSVDGRSEKTIQFDVFADYCGKVNFSIPKIRVYDYLKLWSFSIKYEEEAQAYILPDIHRVLALVSERTRNFPVEGEEYDPHRSGDDPSEIFQTREFRAGDTLQRVHWKMSAKADELMTKEFSMPIGCSVLLLLDLHLDKKQHSQGMPSFSNGKIAHGQFELAQIDAFYEIAASISHGLMEAGCRHYAGWLEEETGEIRRQYVQDETQVYEMIYQMLHLAPYLQECELVSAYQAAYREASFSTILLLNISLQLIRNGEVIADFSRDGISEMLEGLSLEV